MHAYTRAIPTANQQGDHAHGFIMSYCLPVEFVQSALLLTYRDTRHNGGPTLRCLLNLARPKIRFERQPQCDAYYARRKSQQFAGGPGTCSGCGGQQAGTKADDMDLGRRVGFENAGVIFRMTVCSTISPLSTETFLTGKYSQYQRA